MKKYIIALLFSFLLTLNACFALTEKAASVKINSLRTVKKAEIAALNKKIKTKTDSIANIYANDNLKDNEKDIKIKKIQEDLEVLYQKKSDIKTKYAADKKAIKSQIIK